MHTRALGQLALEIPQSIDVFETFGLDFCCRGDRSLAEACAEAGLPVDEVVAAIEERAPRTPEWSGGDPGALIDHILVTYHRPLERELRTLERLSEKVARVHGERHPALRTLRSVLLGLTDELRQHLDKEEQVLFPMIRAGLTGLEHGPIQVMLQEHDEAGEALRTLRRLTANHTPPAEACTAWKALYAALADFERTLHRHIHLENNLLFPMVTAH